MNNPDDHAVIWLAPDCGKGNCGDERTWCQDRAVYDPCPECGREPTKYVRAPSEEQT